MEPQNAKPSIFISYSHSDKHWKDRIVKQLGVLENEGLCSVWEDRKIESGEDWLPEIVAALNSCSVALLLISTDFLSSEFIRGKEVPNLLMRRKNKGVNVIPVIITPSLFKQVGWLSPIQVFPEDGIALSGLNAHDQEVQLVKLAEQIIEFVEKRKILGKNFGFQAEERFLDAAMPQQVVVHETTELLTMIRLPDSEGLRKKLHKQSEFQAQPTDVKSKPFEANFPIDEAGNPTFIDFLINIETNDFKLKESYKKVMLNAFKDSEICIFFITPLHTGELRLLIQVYLMDILIKESFFKVSGFTNIDKQIKSLKSFVTTISLGIFSTGLSHHSARLGEFIEQPTTYLDNNSKIEVMREWLQNPIIEKPQVADHTIDQIPTVLKPQLHNYNPKLFMSKIPRRVRILVFSLYLLIPIKLIYSELINNQCISDICKQIKLGNNYLEQTKSDKNAWRLASDNFRQAKNIAKGCGYKLNKNDRDLYNAEVEYDIAMKNTNQPEVNYELAANHYKNYFQKSEIPKGGCNK